MLRCFSAFICILLFSIPLSLTAQVAVNQTDNFQDGTLHGWTTGAPNPNPPTNVSSNGPAGASDKYMRVTSSGSSGAGGRLVVRNLIQWIGNYTSAGVTSISMNVKNEGSTALQLRVALIGSAGNGVSTTAVSLPVGSGWTSVSFPITADALTGTNIASTLTNVTELRLLYASTPNTKGDIIAAQLGVDDITAVGSTNAVASGLSSLPEEFALLQNYPNPFNPTTAISFQLSAVSDVTLEVFDVTGKKVASLADGVYPAGAHSIRWDATGVSSGIYLCRLTSVSHDDGQTVFSAVRKMAVLK
jgi:hypothetical protein